MCRLHLGLHKKAYWDQRPFVDHLNVTMFAVGRTGVGVEVVLPKAFFDAVATNKTLATAWPLQIFVPVGRLCTVTISSRALDPTVSCCKLQCRIKIHDICAYINYAHVCSILPHSPTLWLLID